MAETLVQRLRAEGPLGMLSGCMDTVRYVNPDGPEAAAEIERLTAEVERYREALARIADPKFNCVSRQWSIAMMECARQALAGKEGSE